MHIQYMHKTILTDSRIYFVVKAGLLLLLASFCITNGTGTLYYETNLHRCIAHDILFNEVRKYATHI